MVKVDCETCTEKCCTYPGWKVFFLEEERQRVLEIYGSEFGDKIEIFQNRRDGRNVYSTTLPCPFFVEATGKCGIYKAQPFVCQLFPVEIEPITGTTYLEERVCPKREEAKPDWPLIQIEVESWCQRFWAASSDKKPPN